MLLLWTVRNMKLLLHEAMNWWRKTRHFTMKKRLTLGKYMKFRTWLTDEGKNLFPAVFMNEARIFQLLHKVISLRNWWDNHRTLGSDEMTSTCAKRSRFYVPKLRIESWTHWHQFFFFNFCWINAKCLKTTKLYCRTRG